MIQLPSISPRPVAVLGLGRSGLATARALLAGGNTCWAWDDSPDVRAAAQAHGVAPTDLTRCDMGETDTLVLSPGIPHTYPVPHPVVARARAAGCEVIGDGELLARVLPDAGYVGITGTNGKSTTTALIGHILKAAGRDCEVGGNLGVPVLELRPLGADGIYVLEMSSYQLELVRSLIFRVAVLLNITPDHLERHGGIDGYIAAKRAIFRGQGPAATAVVGVDDEPCREIFAALNTEGGPKAVPISGSKRVSEGVFALAGRLYDDTGGSVPVLDLAETRALPGEHNAQNAAAAYATARAVGVDPATACAAIRTFPGLAHRQEIVGVVNGVTYVNDSKATNPDAAARALACYETIYWIAGGRPKQGPLTALDPYLNRVRHAFLIGEASEPFAAALDGRMPVARAGTLEAAVAAARVAAERDGLPGAVVLLSPACASFDQFRNFEVRGDTFRGLVEDLGAMISVARTDTSLLGRWLWTVDRWTFGALLLIGAIGFVLTMAASPAVAERLGLDSFYFARRQSIYLPLALVVMLLTSLMSPKGVRRAAVIGFVVAAVLTLATLLEGETVKGATRWIRIGGLSIQPSEFLKPAFAVLTAWLIAGGRMGERFPGHALAILLTVSAGAVLLLQPDVGTTLLLAGIWSVQVFLAGLPLILVGGIALLFLGGGVAAYFTFDHVRGRVDHFLDPTTGDGFQISSALEAFKSGGLFGRGPGEGRVKEFLPDAHADFIFAVAGEEFGLAICLILVGLFAFVVLRGFGRSVRSNDLFVVLAGGGLIALFGMQALMNMASTTHLIPPKGITLPFISYGGSSTLALAWGMGMVLALTRERPGNGGVR